MAKHDLRGDDDVALATALADKQRQLVKGQFAHSLGRLQNTASLRRLRVEVARIQTELRRRELAAGLAKNSIVSKHRVVSSGRSGGEAASSPFFADVAGKLGE